MTEDEITNLSNAFDNFANGNGTPEDLQLINTALKDLKIASIDTINGMDALADQMAEMLIAGGMSEDVVNELVTKLRQLSNEAPIVANNME
jgi:hypothetical protein